MVRHPKWIWNQELRLWQVATSSTGEVIYTVLPLDRYEYELNHRNWPESDTVQVPCGHCIGCQLDRSRQWADRMLCELQSAQGKGVFVTLTYAPERVPVSWYKDNNDCLHRSYTLKKEDLQAFNKRLRHAFDGSGHYGDLPVRRIRFYGAGEYGEMTLRPHYHEIFFGLSLEDVQAVPATDAAGNVVKNELGHVYYRSKLLEKLWPFGLVSCAEVSWRTCAYVARYVTKKWQSGYKTKETYQFFGVIPEFSLMSRRPGIGAEYFESWLDSHEGMDLLDVSKLSLSDQEGAKQIKVPKYVKRKYKDSDDCELREKYRILAGRAIEASDSRIALQLDKTDLEYLEMLKVAERNRLGAMNALKRDKV